MRCVIGMLVVLSLAACGVAGKRGSDGPIAVYDLGVRSASPRVEKRAFPMAIEVRAPLWFDSLGIAYRLNYAEPGRIREYARARWVGPPAQLIQTRLAGELDLVMAGQARARCVIRVEIDEFSQVFDAPSASRGMIRGRVLWLDRGRAPRAEQPVLIELPAPTPDSLGAVAALSQGVSRLGGAIEAQEKALVEAGKLAGCQS